jgi:hypothetical protein
VLASGADGVGSFSGGAASADALGMSETFHVVPLEDWLVHEEVQDACVCGPHVEFFARGKVVVHHALDGRHGDDPGWPRRRALEAAHAQALLDPDELPA